MNASIADTSHTLKPASDLSRRPLRGYGNRGLILDGRSSNRPRYVRARPSPHALEIRTRRLALVYDALSGLACLMFFGGICAVLWGLS